MPFDGNAERSAPVRLPDAPHGEPHIEARIIDEALTILGPDGEKWIQGREADKQHNHCMIGAIKRLSLVRREAVKKSVEKSPAAPCASCRPIYPPSPFGRKRCNPTH
jgi:hypothetical protein